MNQLIEINGGESLQENEVKIFEFEQHGMEVVYLNGEPLFNPYHVAECLGLSEGSVRAYVSEMTGNQRVKIRDLAQNENFNFKLKKGDMGFWVRESGLYQLIFKSRKPEAQRFVDWVTNDVLPQIRKTGSYSIAPEQQWINQITSTVENFLGVRKRELAIFQNESPNKKLWNLMLDCSTNGLGSPEFLYEELHYIFASETGINIPEIAKLKGMKTRDYLRKNKELAQTLYEFAYRHFKIENSRQIVLLPADQKKLTEFKEPGGI